MRVSSILFLLLLIGFAALPSVRAYPAFAAPVSVSYPPTNDEVYTVLVVEHYKHSYGYWFPDGGTVYIGGNFTEVAGTPRRHAAAFDFATGKLLPWNPDVNGPVHAMAIATHDIADGMGGVVPIPDNIVYIGGDFSQVGGTARKNLAAVDAAGGTPSSWKPDPDGTVRALCVADGRLYTGGDFAAVGTDSRARLAAFSNTDLALQPWNPGADGRVRALAASGGALYVGGDFQQLGGAARPFAGAFATSGDLLAWAPMPDGAVRAFAFGGDDGGRVFMAGDFTHIGAMERPYLAAFGPSAGGLLGWKPAPDGPVRALDYFMHILYLGGDFTTVGGSARQRLASVDARSGKLFPWNPGASAPVNALGIAARSNRYYWPLKDYDPDRDGFAILLGSTTFYGVRDDLLDSHPSAIIRRVNGRRFLWGDYTRRAQVRVIGQSSSDLPIESLYLSVKRPHRPQRTLPVPIAANWHARVRLSYGQNTISVRAINTLGQHNLVDEPEPPIYASIYRLRPGEKLPARTSARRVIHR